MKTLIFISLIVLSFNKSLASNQVKNLGAHVHGAVHIDIATDKNQLLVLLKSPADSFLGFEYKAKTKKEKSLVARVEKDWRESLTSMMGKETLKDCKISSAKWTQKFEGKSHSSIEAEAYIDCDSKVQGRTLNITLSEKYSHIENIHLQLLREDGSVINKKYSRNFKVKL